MKMISNFLWSVEWIFFTDLIPYIFWYFYTEIFTIKNCFAVIFRAIFVLSNKSTLLILLRMYALRLKKSKLFGQRIKNSLRAYLSSTQLSRSTEAHLLCRFIILSLLNKPIKELYLFLTSKAVSSDIWYKIQRQNCSKGAFRHDGLNFHGFQQIWYLWRGNKTVITKN